MCHCKKECFTYYRMGSREQIYVCPKTRQTVREQKNWFLHSADEDFMVDSTTGSCDYYVSVPKPILKNAPLV